MLAESYNPTEPFEKTYNPVKATPIHDRNKVILMPGEQLEVLKAHHKSLQGIDGRLAGVKDELRRVNKTLGSMDSRLESMDARLESMDGRLEDLVMRSATTVGLLRGILGKLPERETKAVAKGEDWVSNWIASRDYDALFARLKTVVEGDVQAADAALQPVFAVDQAMSTRFLVVRNKGSYAEWFTTFDVEADRILVGEDTKGRGAPDKFSVTLGLNEDQERREITVTCGVETETFDADELWRISRRAISWMLL